MRSNAVATSLKVSLSLSPSAREIDSITSLILILPFVSIYTGGVTDAEYHQPVFAMLIIAGSYAYSV
ncbi:MAG: hypothetical protein IIY10_00910, partial [Aeriscardovia sp.]|nr:hypothetical protein [Aeriscardovia sp.]